MKKLEFYSLHRVKDHIEAILHNGYTDGKYNYYKNEYGRWFAVCPDTGLSVVYTNTRTEAVEKANNPELVEKLASAMAKDMGKKMIERFHEMIAKKETDNNEQKDY